jgi:WD40 repeat protein
MTQASEKTGLPSSFKVVAGSYEKLLYGLEGYSSAEGSNLSFHLKPIFIFPAHASCIKSVAASPNGGKWLASGSADEIIKVWDLRRRKEIGGLLHHEGSYRTLFFSGQGTNFPKFLSQSKGQSHISISHRGLISFLHQRMAHCVCSEQEIGRSCDR